MVRARIESPKGPPDRSVIAGLSLSRIRLRSVWLLILPFLYFASPTPTLLAVGGTVAVFGLGLRAWSAGSIRKDRVLATGGPYAFTRNPLYLGSLLIGAGVVIAGRSWIFALLFLLFFAVVYGASMKAEARVLEERFGDAYRIYAARVPLLLPRLTPYRSEFGEAQGFQMARYLSNREYEALLGLAAGFALLAGKYLFF